MEPNLYPAASRYLYQLRYTPAWLAAGILILVSIIYLSLATGDVSMPVEVNDKFGHLLAYTVLMLWFGGIFKRRLHWWLALAFFALGVGLEFLQAWGGERMYERADMAMNGLGVLVGKKLCRVGLGGWCQKAERLFNRLIT